MSFVIIVPSDRRSDDTVNVRMRVQDRVAISIQLIDALSEELVATELGRPT